MMEPILHNYWRSSASYRVRIGLNLLGLSYHTDPVDLLAGDQRGPANLARNPQGLVPSLQIDGLELTQSLVILEYLDETRHAGWLPQEAGQKAKARALAYAVAMDIHPICNLPLSLPTPTGPGPPHDGPRVTIHPALWHGLQNASEPAPMNDPANPAFDLQDFLPYLLNQAAEAASLGFQDNYRVSYAVTRTQWRVMANLGKFGAMTARDICHISHIEKTKVSRAVAHMEREGLLARHPSAQDRRAEILSLTDKGLTAFADLGQRAVDYDRALRKELGAKAAKDLNRILLVIIATRAEATAEPDH